MSAVFDQDFEPVFPQGEEEAQPAEGPASSTTTAEAIRAMHEDLVRLKARRKEVNQSVQAVYNRAKALGIPSEVVKRLAKDVELEAEARDALDDFYAMGRKALGLPVQLGLLDED